ncbi:MAG: Holliday junction branch migration protein RuvA, partial [Synergistaceae bacterium]|nr:Holliday junction branch migration protein RuvA [Synergistaceae bacterium]
MIRCLTGTVLSISPNGIVLDVHGIGFEIYCSRGVLSLCNTGQTMTVITYLQVSEAGISIYGFSDEQERELFLKITAIKGVGGKTGISVLSSLSGDEIIRGVVFSDVSVFTRVPGIGKKTAERICFELKNLIGEEFLSQAQIIGAGSEKLPPNQSNILSTVTEALRSLGF